MAIVYRHRRLDTNKIFYVGIGKDEKRAYVTQRNNLWNKIIKKTNYEVEIIATDLSIADAMELEIFLIEQYGRINLKTGTLSNLTDGGEGCKNVVFTQEHKDKISEKLKGIKRSDEFKANLKILKTGVKYSDTTNAKKGSKGEKNGMYGKDSAMKGKNHSEETIKKMSLSTIGKTHSDETKKKLSDNKKLTGKICIDLETGIFYDTLKQAAIAKNIPYTTLKYRVYNSITTIKLI